MTTVLDSLNAGLHRALAADERVHLLGEDILDPYGGAFKVTKGLSTAFPDRVLTTPVSEAGIVGLATGMALRGLRPIVEIMFGDFTTLVVDQVVNHAAKFRSMYNQQVRVPLVIRTPMGGRRGYGATHSQSLEKLFLGVPGLRVLAPTAMADPGALLADAVLGTEDPVLFVEHKILYLSPLWDAAASADFAATVSPGGTTTYNLSARWTLLTWAGPSGVMVSDAVRGTGISGGSDLSARISAIYLWDPAVAAYKAYFTGAESIPGASDFSQFLIASSFSPRAMCASPRLS